MKSINESIMGLICIFLFVQGIFVGLLIPERCGTNLSNELLDLYTWNYVETSNPTKEIRLRAAIERLKKEEKLSPCFGEQIKILESLMEKKK